MRNLFPDRWRRRARAAGERGVAMIEFSIASGIMVLILLGTFAYGEILSNYIELKYAVGELSRQVAVGQDAADRQNRFDAARAQVFGPDGMDPDCVTVATPSFASGQVVVTVTYNFNTAGCRLMPSFFLPTPDQLTATNTFNVP
ncbi:TadE/TadG family type IV pilus assembly protein [Zavarzinia aquatilis]|uniref:TadE-like domain-containing protein n=1 Tax=Zavarzinia aquatilis TaxID=2211142 RepID=A0A317E8D0_9PROT|nr:TadE/TadG family type IV pilus assembly protein [Zavarzinia aquatilis]PWR22792.1 hypothetical protein DKG74_10185 [Zavarzinia aquatilis]